MSELIERVDNLKISGDGDKRQTKQSSRHRIAAVMVVVFFGAFTVPAIAISPSHPYFGANTAQQVDSYYSFDRGLTGPDDIKRDWSAINAREAEEVKRGGDEVMRLLMRGAGGAEKQNVDPIVIIP